MDIFLLNVSLSSGSIPSATGNTARSLLFGGKSKSLGAKRFEKGRAKSGTNPEALIFKQHLYMSQGRTVHRFGYCEPENSVFGL